MKCTYFRCCFSFLEIYNERVHDLLAGEAPVSLNSLPRRKGNSRKDLRVREHPTKGPYVQNLRRVTVHDVETLLAVVNEGTRRRRTAATKRNICSSRSHALLELVTPQATLHLADLAGSEKAGWEGNAGGRQNEGANINKSLVALSNVISALVSGGSGRGRFVPYRNSALTWLLKDCFTGGGSTFIIATVSPSASCYGESASTLRWAARARRLPNERASQATNVVSKAALQAQFNQLLAELAKHFIQYKPETRQLLYDDKHWTLRVNGIDDKGTTNTVAKIGNIMNLRYSKGEGRNSESTPSSIASGSSDIINNMDKTAEISNEINKEIDKLFGPALERARSGSDIEVVAPLRHKKRHFRSQEVLSSIDKAPQSNKSHRLSVSDLSETQGDDSRNVRDSKVPSVSILYDNQRAEIIASVTERLYSKLKKNEATASKADLSVDKKPTSESKIMQPLNELKICSNARQRLMEISKKALRNKRKIGIPAHTQTRKTVIRVKDQAIDVQTDLQAYISHQRRTCTFQRDVSTETTPMTPRLKEIAVGPRYSNLCFKDNSTATESKKVTYRNSCTMTDIIPTSNHSSQTIVLPPPRRKRRQSAYSKYIKKLERIKSTTDDTSISPVININISPMYTVDSESQSSDETLDNTLENGKDKEKQSVTTTPDLLTNHNNMSKKAVTTVLNDNNCNVHCVPNNEENITPLELKETTLEDFSDKDDVTLPRITIDHDRKISRKDYEDLILGRNKNLYPYSIKLSPCKEKNEAKTLIRFKDIDVTPAECCSNEWQRKVDVATNNLRYSDSDKDITDSDNSISSVFSNIDSDTFLWNKISSAKYDNSIGHTRDNRFEKYPKHGLSESRYKDDDNFQVLRNKKGLSCPDSRCDDEYCSSKRQNERIIAVKHRPHSLKKKNEYSTFDTIERKIKSACNSLEDSVNKYDNYLMEFRDKTKKYYKNETNSRTPTEYLQHLIKLRREAVQSDSHNK